jgi:hypothetical protein
MDDFGERTIMVENSICGTVYSNHWSPVRSIVQLAARDFYRLPFIYKIVFFHTLTKPPFEALKCNLINVVSYSYVLLTFPRWVRYR